MHELTSPLLARALAALHGRQAGDENQQQLDGHAQALRVAHIHRRTHGVVRHIHRHTDITPTC